MNIIRAEEKYLPEIMKLENACFAPSWSEQSVLSEFTAEGADFLLDVDGDEIMGFCSIRTMYEDAELFQIAVSPEHRRNGLAEKMLNYALDCAKSRGAEKMMLEVRQGNAPAIALYEKLGFTRIALRKNYYEQPVENAVIMELRF